MSNRRIQKKRAKVEATAQWERDKSTLIAEFLVWADPDASRAEQVRCALLMWGWKREKLLRRIDEMLLYRLTWYTSPLRRMLKRP